MVVLEEGQWQKYAADALNHLCRLIAIDTTNPPGNEINAARYIYDNLEELGLHRIILESEPKRGNVIVRLAGDGTRKPLLFVSHLDVVAARPENWIHPPLSGQQAEGYVWGRGAVDMKYMAALCLTLLKLLVTEKVPLKRDLIFAGTADEETGGHKGAGWLVSHHPELIAAEYALTEVGGFTLHLLGKRFVPIQIAEKGFCWLKLKISGTAGHGSIPHPDNPLFGAGHVLSRLQQGRLPCHLTPLVQQFLHKIAAEFSPPLNLLIRSLTVPPLNEFLIDYLFPDRDSAAALHALLRNTVTPTIIRGGEKVNVIPGEVSLQLDGRILPGYNVQTFLKELRSLLGMDLPLEVLSESAPVEFSADTPFFRHIEAVVQELDPETTVIPMLTTGSTDAHHLARIPIVTYGYVPMQLPADLKFERLFHGVNERIPIASLRYGLHSLLRLVEKANE